MNILVISPHPDDEAIGMGGTIRRHTKNGDVVAVAYLSSGEKGAGEDSPPGLAARREGEANTACRVLGVMHNMFVQQPDGAVQCEPCIDAILDWLTEIDFKPERIYATSALETHVDHIAGAVVGEEVAAHFDCPVLYYEIWTPFAHYDAIVDVTAEMNDKLEAIRAHESQVERIDFDKAALGLARYRGTLHNRPHGAYAEVFSK